MVVKSTIKALWFAITLPFKIIGWMIQIVKILLLFSLLTIFVVLAVEVGGIEWWITDLYLKIIKLLFAFVK